MDMRDLKRIPNQIKKKDARDSNSISVVLRVAILSTLVVTTLKNLELFVDVIILEMHSHTFKGYIFITLFNAYLFLVNFSSYLLT